MTKTKNRAVFVIIFCILASIICGVSIARNPTPFEKNQESSKRDNILVILVDTLRADHLGCYGYSRNTSPYIDKISQEGVRFTNFYTTCPWTNPSVATIFSGLYPQAVFQSMGPPECFRQVFPEKIETLAEVLSKNGYFTIGLSDQPGIKAKFGYHQGFKNFTMMYRKRGILTSIGNTIPDIMDEFEKLLDRAGKKEFFFYVHLIYPHSPYDPPAPYKTMFGNGAGSVTRANKQGVINLYDGEVRYTDDLIKAMIDDIDNRGLLKDTYIIITADHGEEFWEHGFDGHGKTLFNEVLRVPLIIIPPGGRRGEPDVINALTSNIDLFPTIMDMARIAEFPAVEGKSLRRFFNKGFKEKGALVYSENPHSIHIDALSCQNDRLKHIYVPSDDTHILFDLTADPGETKNIAKKGTAYQALHNQLMRHKRANESIRKKLGMKMEALDEDFVQQLKSLGYIN